LASHILGNFGHKYSKFLFIHYMLKQLNLRCSKLPTPKTWSLFPILQSKYSSWSSAASFVSGSLRF